MVMIGKRTKRDPRAAKKKKVFMIQDLVCVPTHPFQCSSPAGCSADFSSLSVLQSLHCICAVVC